MMGAGEYGAGFVWVVSLAACLTLAPLLAAAFFGERSARWANASRVWVRMVRPAVLCVPYVLVSCANDSFRWKWLLLYTLLPVVVAGLMLEAKRVDPERMGNWRDFLVLAVLGLAVDLRWFEGAWPAHLSAFNKILLLDMGIYGFMFLRELDGVGFDLRLKWRDLGVGVREYLFYAPMALLLGLGLRFLHVHARWPRAEQAVEALVFTFLFVAIPEELFFRGWLQNLLERRMGQTPALLLTALLFGMSHFNKRAVHFNWRYVLMAALAGIFYGRAWRQRRRVGTSAITHALVDTTWSLWLR